MKRVHVVAVAALVLLAAGAGAWQGTSGADRLNADVFSAMTVRNIGPALTTGRVQDVEIDPKNSNVWYVATAFGGLWKTTNRGISFEEIFPRSGQVEGFNLCCVVVDPKDSNIVWLGTGENASQRSAHFGTGLYKSTDAGKSWTRVGLENSEHIGRIQVDPRNSNVVWVASQGPLFSAGGDRGVYKTTDGGATWTRVLFVNDDTGFSDLVLDPRQPDTVFASTYQRRRHVGQMIGGGPDGGIWKTTNGGKTFTKLTKDLPPGEVGRISLAVDPKKPGRIYAIIDAKSAPEGGRGGRGGAPGAAGGRGGGRGADPAAQQQPAPPPAPVPPLNPPTVDDGRGFYRSEDGGATWERMSRFRGGGPAYYSEIFVDPRFPDTVWGVDATMPWTRDGGRTWQPVGIERGGGAFAVHVDHHVVEFDPADPTHILIGNDGGLYESNDGAQSFRFFANIPVTQFYRASAGYERPFYTVCGGTQDNFSFCGPSRTTHVLGTRTSDWYIVNGGDGFQSRHDTEDPNIVYATSQSGGIVRFDRRTGRTEGIRPSALNTRLPDGGSIAGTPGDRTNWDAPYTTSAHSPTRLYWATQYVYRTDDRGTTWTRISGDLSRNLNRAEIPIMGRVWPQGSIALHESTTPLSNIVSIDESPLVEGLIYVGTDDGLLQVTEDGGKNWRRVEDFPNVAKWAYVADVFASPRDPNVVFATLNNWQRGDYKPYVVRSNDRGRTWTNITGNLPPLHDAWTIAQDHVNGDLLFVGTEFGLFFTVDGGQRWTQLRGGMPPTQVRDLHIQKRENDVVMATFGRGFWILDDYSALREVSAQALGEEARLFPLRHAYQFTPWGLAPAGSAGLATLGGNYTFPNPPNGAVLTYHVGQVPVEGTSHVVRIFNSQGAQVQQITLDRAAGLKRVEWNLRGTTGAPVPGDPMGEPTELSDEELQQQGQAGGRGAGGAQGQAGGRGAGGAQGQAGPPVGGRGGRGGGAPFVTPGTYRAVLGKLTGETFTQLGPAQTFQVLELPEQNYRLYR